MVVRKQCEAKDCTRVAFAKFGERRFCGTHLESALNTKDRLVALVVDRPPASVAAAVGAVIAEWTDGVGVTVHERHGEDGSVTRLVDAIADAAFRAIGESLVVRADSSASAARGRYEAVCARAGVDAAAFEACALQDWIDGKVTRDAGADYWLWLADLLTSRNTPEPCDAAVRMAPEQRIARENLDAAHRANAALVAKTKRSRSKRKPGGAQ